MKETTSMPELRQKSTATVVQKSIRSNAHFPTASNSRRNQQNVKKSFWEKFKSFFASTPGIINSFRNSITLDAGAIGRRLGTKPSRRPEPTLTGAEEDTNTADKEAPIIVLTYSQTLHRSMRVLWIPITLMGRIPFKLSVQRNRATIKLEKCSVPYIMCTVGVVCMWCLLLWFSVGTFMMLFQKDPGVNSSTNATLNTERDMKFLERRISKLYWIDLFIFWTTLFQATVATTHILVFGKSYAGFVREWYKVLDLSKTQISKSLMQFIILHWCLLLSLVLLMIILFSLTESWPIMTRTCQMIVAIYFKPIVNQHEAQDSSGTFYFERYASIGLIIYIVAVIFSWFSIIMFLVFCRCFRNALKLMNQRIRMLLNPADEARLGPNAIRLDYITVHKDYVAIAFTGLKAGTVFGHIMLSFFCWSVLCLVFLLGSLVYYGAENPTSKENVEFLNATFPGTNLQQKNPALPHVLNLCGHLILAATTIIIITMGPAECYREGRLTYELATYKGLFLAQTQLERNFIRSLWILASDKFPLAISSKGYFKMTRGMLIAFLSCVFTYFIFLVQSRSQLNIDESTGNLTDNETSISPDIN